MAKKKKYFAWSPVRNLMAEAGAKMVSKDAVNYVIDWLQEQTVAIAEKAEQLARHAKRKKITKNDIVLATKE